MTGRPRSRSCCEPDACSAVSAPLINSHNHFPNGLPSEEVPRPNGWNDQLGSTPAAVTLLNFDHLTRAGVEHHPLRVYSPNTANLERSTSSKLRRLLCGYLRNIGEAGRYDRRRHD